MILLLKDVLRVHYGHLWVAPGQLFKCPLESLDEGESGGQRSSAAFLLPLTPILHSGLTENQQALLSGALHVLRVT